MKCKNDCPTLTDVSSVCDSSQRHTKWLLMKTSVVTCVNSMTKVVFFQTHHAAVLCGILNDQNKNIPSKIMTSFCQDAFKKISYYGNNIL